MERHASVYKVSQLIISEKQNHEIKRERTVEQEMSGSVEKRVLIKAVTKNSAVTLAETENTARIPPLC